MPDLFENLSYLCGRNRMQLQIEATDKITTLDGVQCRYWEGVTEDGIPCKVFVHRIAVRDDNDSSKFEAELTEKMPPGRVVPLKLILD